MLKSLLDYGQMSPVVVCQLDGQTVLIDGFKRLRAARTLKGHDRLVTQFLETDEQGAKAAIFNLNRIAGRPVELEEAWIIYALVLDDGLQQIEVAQMLGRHKSRRSSSSKSLGKLLHNHRSTTFINGILGSVQQAIALPSD